jgi:hypothetical protein
VRGRGEIRKGWGRGEMKKKSLIKELCVYK